MAKYEDHDHYLDPETGILRNRLGITDESNLDKAEAAFVAWRSYELSQKPIEGGFDLAHLQAIHRHLFGDVYDWAGEIRTIDLSRGHTYFANHARIIEAARPIFQKLQKERCLKGLDATEFSKRLAYYLGEINALHPFREGNGRAQREFINHLARANRYIIDWTSINREDMTQASIEAFHRGDTAMFTGFIRNNLRRLPSSGEV
ncbi:MAG: Fic family protein [Candidatus Competibacter denitrificans]